MTKCLSTNFFTISSLPNWWKLWDNALISVHFVRLPLPYLSLLSVSVCSVSASCSSGCGKLFRGDTVSYMFGSALGAFRAFGDWWFGAAELGDVIGFGVIICALAFAYALSHKNTL